MFPSIPFGIGCLEAVEATSEVTPRPCSKCGEPFYMDSQLELLAKKEGMSIEAVICLTCLSELHWAGDAVYPESIEEYH